MKAVLMSLAIFVGSLTLVQGVWAERAFVTDTFTITFRTGPSIENKIIAMLASGEPLEVLERQGDWVRVRRLAAGDDQKEGWVLSRFLVKRQPWENKARSLLEENASLKERLSDTEGKLRKLMTREKELTGKLEQGGATLRQVQESYEELKQGAADFLQLKENHDGLRSDFEKVQSANEELKRKVESLELSQKVRWFLAGASVFLGGWLIGIWMGRLQKKRRESISFTI